MTISSGAVAQQKLELLNEVESMVRQQAAEADKSSSLSADVVAWLRRHGFYRLWVPRIYGGSQMSLPEIVRIYERAALIDGAFGWSIMIGCGGGLFAAFLQSQIAEELFSVDYALVAGSGLPTGKAVKEAGGYRVSGRWRFASGIHQSSMVTASCAVYEGDQPVTDEQGHAILRAVVLKPEQVRVEETWDTQGMRATGSHDFVVQDQPVAEEMTFTLAAPVEACNDTLYRLPFKVVTDLPVAAVGLGIARHLVSEFTQLAGSKKRRGSDESLLENGFVQAALATARGDCLLLSDCVERRSEWLWQLAERGEVTGEQIADCTLASSQALENLKNSLSKLMGLSGMHGMQKSSVLSRAWQDYQGVCAHGSITPLARMSAMDVCFRAADIGV